MLRSAPRRAFLRDCLKTGAQAAFFLTVPSILDGCATPQSTTGRKSIGDGAENLNNHTENESASATSTVDTGRGLDDSHMQASLPADAADDLPDAPVLALEEKPESLGRGNGEIGRVRRPDPMTPTEPTATPNGSTTLPSAKPEERKTPHKKSDDAKPVEKLSETTQEGAWDDAPASLDDAEEHGEHDIDRFSDKVLAKIDQQPTPDRNSRNNNDEKRDLQKNKDAGKNEDRLLRVATSIPLLSLSMPSLLSPNKPVDQKLFDKKTSWLQKLLPTTVKQLKKFSFQLQYRTEVLVHLDQDTFLQAIHRNEDWLRAWAQFDRIHILDPSLWREDASAIRQERLTHEICHTCVYQMFGSVEMAVAAKIPLWFSEGMASSVAGQGRRRMPLQQILDLVGDENPLLDGSWFAKNHYVAYGASHHAASLLRQQYGDDILYDIISETVYYTKNILPTRPKSANPLDWALRSVCNETPQTLWQHLQEGVS